MNTGATDRFLEVFTRYIDSGFGLLGGEVAFLATTGLIRGAVYMLYLYRRVIFGVITKDDVRSMLDLNWREIAVFAPLIAIVIWMGIYPSSFLHPMQPAISHIVQHIEASRQAAHDTSLAQR